jgi:hypothetical protein
MLRAHPAARRGLAYEFEGNARDTWFYDRREALLAESHEWSEHDFLSEHEQLLGRSIAALALNVGLDRIEGETVDNTFLYALQAATGKVLVTLGGVIGDSGAYCSKWICWLKHASQARLWNDERLFRTAVRCREIFSVVPTPTIDRSGFCAATTMAFANYEDLPPFIPIGRNSDGVFGALLKKTGASAFAAHTPTAVFHAANHGREYSSLPEFRLSDLMISLFGHFCSTDNISVSSLVRLVGRDLIELGALPDADCNEILVAAVLERESRRIRRISRKIDRIQNEAPKCALEELKQYKEYLLRRSLAMSCTVASSQICPLGSDRLKITKTILSKIGHLLYSWSDIVSASAYLKGKGRRITSEVRQI